MCDAVRKVFGGGGANSEKRLTFDFERTPP